MDNPIKKKSLIPRMFKAFTFYFFVVLAVFFGYVELFGGVKTINGVLPTGGAVGEIDTSFSDFVSNMTSMRSIYLEDLQFTFESSKTKLSLSADVALDMATKELCVDADLNLNGKLYNVGVAYVAPEVYVSIGDSTYRFISSTEQGELDLSGVVGFISQKLQIDLSFLDELQKKLGIDFNDIDMSALLSQLSISTKKADGQVKISIIAMNLVEAMIVCDEQCVMQSATVNGINIGSNVLSLSAPKVEMNSENILDKIQTPASENVIDMGGLTDYAVYAQNLFTNKIVEADITVDVAGQKYAGKLIVDNSETAKVSVETKVEDIDVCVVYSDEQIYVKAGDFGVFAKLSDVLTWKDKLVEIIESKTSKSVSELVSEILDEYIGVNVEDIELQEEVKTFLKNLLSNSENIDVLLPSETNTTDDSFVMAWDNGLVVELSNEAKILSAVSVAYDNVSANIDFHIGEKQIELPTGCQDLNPILMKAENLLNYIEKGIFEFDFTVSYNGLDFVGTFKYSDGVIEIADVLAAGELANIRIENNNVYFSYGNMKLKFPVPENNGSDESKELQDTLSKLTSDTLGVEINFGVFEELLTMLSSYTAQDWKENLVVDLSGNQDDIRLSVSNKNGSSLSEILLANVTFKDNKLEAANVSIYEILTAHITLNDVEQSTIKTFDEEEYKEYSEDFVAGALDSLEVVTDVYGFSSDIAIRYSKTTFYGEIVALVVKDELNPANLGGFVPALSIHTTSLGLNSYIYLIGRTLYIDINGLQIYADLNETSINDVMSFIESKFGVSFGTSALSESMTALRVILPAIDQIYGSWITENGNGLQININDALWYGEQSRFEDIVLQAFITNYNNTIVPTKLVIGANIYDPNTLVYDDYSDAWLDAGTDESGNKLVIEDSITKELNFGAYFTNISVGRFAESIDRVFAIENRNYQDINKVMSNYGVSELSDFNSYSTVLTLVDTVYDYGMSLNYQIALSGTVSDETSEMKLGGDVVVSVADLGDEQEAKLDLFGGKSLKVQGNLDIITNGVQHLVDLLYSNVDEGLYLTYTHGNNIEKGNKFKAKISNTNMSEIISMLVKFANLNLSDSMKQAWNIDYCSTDFSYVQSLLGLGETDIGGEVSKADVALNSVESITKMLGLIKLEKVVGELGLATTTLSVELKLNENVAPAKVSLVLREELQDGVVVTMLRQIKIENFEFGGKNVELTVDIEDFSEESFNYDTASEHIDFSDVSKLIDTLVTTVNTKNFTFNGDIAVNLGGVVKLDMALDLYISIEDINNPYIFAQVILDTNAIADMVFNGSFDKRLITYEYQDGVLIFHRFSKKKEYDSGLLWRPWEKVVEDSVSRNSYAKDEIIPNLTPIILDSLGMKETFLGINLPNMIVNIIKNINVNPTLEEALIGFTTDANCENTVITLNGANLLGDGAENINLNLGATKYNGYTYDDKGAVIDKTYSCIDSITGLNLKMSGVDISLNLYSRNDVDSYQTTAYELKSSYKGASTGVCGGRTLYTNRYYRTQYINTVGGIYA